MNHAKDIANIRNEGFDVDTENKPVPEYIPSKGTSTNDDLNPGRALGWDGIDRHHIITPEQRRDFLPTWLVSSWIDVYGYLSCIPSTNISS